MHVRSRQQEVRPLRMREPRPLFAERLWLEPRRLDHGLVLVGVERADGINDRPARSDALGRGAHQVELEFGQRLGAPAQVRPSGENPEAVTTNGATNSQVISTATSIARGTR